MAHLADVDGAAPDVEADGALEGLAELEGVHPGGQGTGQEGVLEGVPKGSQEGGQGAGQVGGQEGGQGSGREGVL